MDEMVSVSTEEILLSLSVQNVCIPAAKYYSVSMDNHASLRTADPSQTGNMWNHETALSSWINNVKLASIPGCYIIWEAGSVVCFCLSQLIFLIHNSRVSKTVGLMCRNRM